MAFKKIVEEPNGISFGNENSVILLIMIIILMAMDVCLCVFKCVN
jgi:hypothetical protein